MPVQRLHVRRQRLHAVQSWCHDTGLPSASDRSRGHSDLPHRAANGTPDNQQVVHELDHIGSDISWLPRLCSDTDRSYKSTSSAERGECLDCPSQKTMIVTASTTAKKKLTATTRSLIGVVDY